MAFVYLIIDTALHRALCVAESAPVHTEVTTVTPPFVLQQS